MCCSNFAVSVCLAWTGVNSVPTGNLHPLVTVVDRNMYTDFVSNYYASPLGSLRSSSASFLKMMYIVTSIVEKLIGNFKNFLLDLKLLAKFTQGYPLVFLAHTVHTG